MSAQLQAHIGHLDAIQRGSATHPHSHPAQTAAALPQFAYAASAPAHTPHTPAITPASDPIRTASSLAGLAKLAQHLPLPAPRGHESLVDVWTRCSNERRARWIAVLCAELKRLQLDPAAFLGAREPVRVLFFRADRHIVCAARCPAERPTRKRFINFVQW